MAHVRLHLDRLSKLPLEMRLARSGALQKERFDALARSFPARYQEATGGTDHLTTDLWKEFNAALEADFLPAPSYAFLRHPVIERTMFTDARGRYLRDLASSLEAALGKHALARLAREDDVGRPRSSSGVSVPVP